MTKPLRNTFVGCLFALAIFAPLVSAMLSPLLQWRNAVYILASFAGIVALLLLLVQPMLAGRLFPVRSLRWRGLHRWVGAAIAASVVVHVVALWITSPPDVIDALLFASPTPFSVWGVVAMWSVGITACLAIIRSGKRINVRLWRISHKALAVITVACTVLHILYIDGLIDSVTKALFGGVLVVVSVIGLKAR